MMARRIAFLWLLAMGQGAFGAAGGAMPEALEGIAPAGHSCKRDEAAPQPRSVAESAAPAVVADLSCAISVPEVVNLRSRNAAFLVDTRSPREFEAVHVDGALNATPAEVRSKTFLRDRMLVLVGSGKAEQELYVACTELKSRGFPSVKVLRGGLPLWQAQGQPTVGARVDGGLPPTLSTAELWLESQFEANLVLMAPSHAALNDQLPYAVPLAQVSASAIKSVLDRRRRELKNAPLSAVVLVADAATLSASAQRALTASMAPVPLLIYAHPAEVFMREMRQQQLSWTALARGPRQPPCGR